MKTFSLKRKDQASISVRFNLVTNLGKFKNKSKSRQRLKIKICHFWEFHKSQWIKKRHKSRVTRIKKKRRQRKLGTTPITDHEKKWWKREKNACVAVKRGVRVRRNCNIFNLAMENVLKGLPDKIQDQLSRHHTQMHFKCTHFWITFKLRDRGDDIGFLYT